MRLLSVSAVAKTMMQCTRQAALRRLKAMALEHPGLLVNMGSGPRKVWKVNPDVLKHSGHVSLKACIEEHDERLQTCEEMLRALASFVGYRQS